MSDSFQHSNYKIYDLTNSECRQYDKLVFAFCVLMWSISITLPCSCLNALHCSYPTCSVRMSGYC